MTNSDCQFFHLQFVFEKLTVLSFNDNNSLDGIAINTNLSGCVLFDDRKELNFSEWPNKSKNFNVGKTLIISVNSSSFEVLLYTSIGTLKEQILITDLVEAKPIRRVIQICDHNAIPSFQLQCIVFKRSLYFKPDVIENVSVKVATIGVQTDIRRVQFREVGVNSIQSQAEKSTQTLNQPNENAVSTPQQRQILMRMAIILVNRVHARLLEHQMGRRSHPPKVDSKLINTDFTIPTKLTNINNAVRVEHLRDIKQRLQNISKQHRENLLAKPARIKRPCQKSVEQPKKEEKKIEQESVKSWISSLHSEKQNQASSVKSSTSLTSEETSDESSEDSDSSTQSESTTSESESEETEKSISEKDSSSASSVPTEINSNVSISEKSYLESVASSSETPKMSPTSEYLKKLRADIARNKR